MLKRKSSVEYVQAPKKAKFSKPAKQFKGRPVSAALVKRMIDNSCEKKTKSLYSSELSLANGLNGASWQSTTIGNVQPISGNVQNIIGQGTGQGDRLGNRIKMISAKLELLFYPKPYNVTTNIIPTPQDIRVLLLKMKLSDATATATATSLGTNIWQNGDSTAGPTGDMRDIMYMPNKDDYTIYYDKQFKVGAAAYSTNTGAAAQSYLYTNNDYKLTQKITIDLMKHGFPVLPTYNDTTATANVRSPLYMVVMCVNSDNSLPGGNNGVPISGYYVVNVKFIDI